MPTTSPIAWRKQLETVYKQVDDMPLEQIPELITYLSGRANEGGSEELGV
jgi:hypothetical protein